MTRLRFAVFPWLAWALGLISAHLAHGGILTVEGPTNLIWNGGPSPKMTLKIKNPSGSLTEIINGYQLDLFIAPVGPGPQGALKFNSISTAEIGYVFEGNSVFNPSAVVLDTFAEDFFDFAIGNTSIGPGESYGLVTFDFDPTNFASLSGYYDIQIGPFVVEDGSWYFPQDADGVDYFANAPPPLPVE